MTIATKHALGNILIYIGLDGAALFYTSTLHPHTFHNLRQYTLHRLLSVPSKPYPFGTRAMVVERDTVLVPAGWDSWGKVRVLREGFDCEGASSEWDADLDEGEAKEGGARKIYEEVIADPEADEQVRQSVYADTYNLEST